MAIDLEHHDQEHQMRPRGCLRPPRRASPAGVAALLSAVLLVACGGDPSQGDGDAAAVRRDVARALTSTAEDDCEPTRHATQRFVDQETYSIRELAGEMEKLCRADVEAYAADSVRVSRVKVDGARATARVEAEGGTYGFGTLEVALVRERVWKLDELTGVDVDRAAFDRLQVQFAGVGDAEATRSQTACSTRRLARFSDAQLERAVLTSDAALVLDPVLVCLVGPRLRDQGLSPALIRCVTEALREKGGELLRDLVRADESATSKLFARAASGCSAGAAS